MFGIFKKKEKPILIVKVNGKVVCSILKNELPCEKKPSVKLESGSNIEFIDNEGDIHQHELGNFSGWFHFSVRVHPNLACQADCAITKNEIYDKEAFSKREAKGIRFQPFFITGAQTSNEIFIGKGLFKRGLHFNGTVTNGAISLSCECESCRKSFLINSFHAGFSHSGYFYSESGKYTLSVSDRVSGSPAALSTPDKEQLAELEYQLPKAPDGTTFKYLNSFRCLHCSEPYIDFVKYPEERASEYYGNYFVGNDVLKYDEVSG